MKNIFELWLEIGVWDKKGKLISRQRGKSRSPLKALLQFLLVQMKQNSVTIKDILGDETSEGSAAVVFAANGAADDASLGIIIGTDTTPVDITDYKLVSPISHGSAAGEMLYQAQQFDADVTVDDPDCTFEMWRNWNNNSGASITVRETGIYIWSKTSKKYCGVRDVPTEINVPNGGGCYVKYTLKITE
ncbi:unnamed protein product [marine sediment metagenome]|uniref:Uncharacterized protein n=1 Tax=marine sediment metagenome TaxID=412755 RepID=X1Q7L0_9ZZZZ